MDLAVVVTPPATVPAVIDEYAKARVPVAVVITGGFAEAGKEGEILQRELLGVGAAGGVRIIGPNCFGVANTATGLNASLSLGLPTKGGVSLITQSGAYGMAAYSRSLETGIGFAKIVALGNKSDIDEADLLDYFAKDAETHVVAMLLKSIGDGRKLFEAIATSPKPVVVLKTGRSAGAQRAAASHTAALAGDTPVTLAALREQAATSSRTVSPCLMSPRL